jgi:hypothetical protein
MQVRKQVVVFDSQLGQLHSDDADVDSPITQPQDLALGIVFVEN